MSTKFKNFQIKTRFNQISAVYLDGRLELRSAENALQSAIQLDDPAKLSLKNLESLIAVVLFIAKPKQILMLGTAAGSLLHFLRQHYPEAEITCIDIDAEMIDILLDQKILPQPDEKLKYVIDDARNYINYSSAKFDLVLVDIFNGSQSPEWLLEKTNIDALSSLLHDHSAVAYNILIDSDDMFEQFYKDLRLVYQQQTLCLPIEGYENTIIYGFSPPINELEMSDYMHRALEVCDQHQINYLSILAKIYDTNPSGNGII